MFCDRETTDISKCQAGFLKNIALPLFEVWVNFLDSDSIDEQCLMQLQSNLTYWENKGRPRRKTAIYEKNPRDFRKRSTRYSAQNMRKNTEIELEKS